MAVFTSMARTKGEFKDLILDILFVITKNAAQLFDNVYRENTNALADDLAHTFELLITKIDHKDATSIPKPLWHAYMLLWQAANTLVAGYQSMRVGFPVEAVVIARHAMELQAVALAFFLDPKNFTEYQEGHLKATDCISRVKGLLPEFGRQYGVVKDGSGDGASYPSESSRDSYAHLLARVIPECATKTLCLPNRKVRLCWKRPQIMQLCNRPDSANAALEGWLGKRPQSGEGLLPLS